MNKNNNAGFLLIAATTTIIIITQIGVASPKPVKVTSDSLASVTHYLMKTGWIADGSDGETAAVLSESGVRAAVKDFQAFAGLGNV